MIQLSEYNFTGETLPSKVNIMDEDNNSSNLVVLNNVYGEVCIRKHRRKRQKALVRQMFHDYAKNTTLHGLSYTTKTGITLIEKIFWLITFIVSLCLCSYLIRNVWIKWKINPIIVTISETLVPVRKVAPKKEDIFIACIWHGRPDMNCAKIVSEVLTSEGLCFNINSLAADDILEEDSNIYFNATKHAVNWTMENGYSSYGGAEYPVPGKELGASPDLEIIFKDILSDRDQTCNIVNAGFNKVYIHHPADLPQSSLHHYAVRNGEVSLMALSFNIINTSETLNKYTAETRQCYLADDISLKYFKKYTVSNCMMECVANITYDVCKCAPFYMPHENNTPICDSVDVKCVYHVRVIKIEACRCLPPCYSIDYQAETLKTPFNLKRLVNQFHLENNSSEDNNSGSVVVINNVYGEVCIRKHRRKRQKALVREMFHDYAKNTTLHGLSYTTKTGITLVEKIFWLITFVVSLCLCSYLIRNVWIKWKISPVIVTISETLVPVRKVPFPSMTICPQSKVKASVYNYSYESEKINNFLEADDIFNISIENWPSYDDFSKFDDTSQICDDWRLYLELMSESSDRFRIKLTNTSAADTITSAAPKKEDIFIACIWRGRVDMNCAETVSEVLTSEGLCFNINSLAADDILEEDSNIYFNATKHAVNWTMENGYISYGGEEYPVPGKELGASPDLEIIFQDILSDRDQTCNIVNSGFNKVYIHHPADLPQSSLHYYAVRNEEVSSMALSFNIINTSETLNKYTAETRQCYFADDVTLKYFKRYTVSNCMIECLANITYDICECAAFYMPRDNDTPICEYLSIQCVYDVRELLIKREASESEHACRCLPPCYAIDYEAEILKTPFNLKRTKRFKQFKVANNSSVKYSKLEVYYKASRFISMHRSELFGITDFFANIGGLLSLFLGFSFLSIVELFYYLTLRLFCALRRDLRQEKLQ